MNFENLYWPFPFSQLTNREASMSVKDPSTGNDHIIIPEVFKCLKFCRLMCIQHMQCFSFKRAFKLRVTLSTFSTDEAWLKS